MKTQKLGVLYANKLVRTGGYVSEEEIIGAYAEVYGSTKASKITENKLIIREISQESCAEIYKDLNKEKVEHILVLGDDASIIFNYFYENLLDPQKKIPWTSVLASFQFNKNVPKIWMSQEMEIATVVNFIRKQKEKDHNFKVVIVSTSETSDFTKYFHEKVKRVLERFDIKLSDRIDDADTIIVIGLGDSAHAQKINWLSNYKNKLIVTNSAILEVIDKLGTTVYSTYIYRPNLASVTFNTYKYDSVRINLPELFLKIAFYMTSINPDKGFFYNEYSNYPLYYDEEKYIHIPVEIVEVNRNHQLKYKTENYKNYVTSLEQLSYSITGGTGVDDDMFGSYGILEVSCIFNYNQHFLVESQNQYGDQSIRNHDFQVYNDIVKSIFRIDDNSLFPIQINLEDEDVNDNVTYRLCMKIDNIRRYPIVIPTDFKNKEINICLVPNLTCDLQNEICVNIGNLQNFIEEINYCRSNFNYVYILPYVEDQNKYGYTFIGSRKKLSSIHLHLWQLKLTPIVSKLHVECISKTILQESLKSAKAAIMSRNMSHNLGSHVMFYIKQKLQSVSKIVDSKVLDNIIPGKIPDIAAVEAAIKANKGIELPFLVGLGRFINYLQERQDYIATIATDYIPANSTISFKDFIYDELKPELRYQRHHSNSDDAGWKSGNLLLDYIAYSEGYRSCDKIEILFGEFNGNTPVKDSNPDKDFQKLREFNIAVPGGVIGRQALFSIFENIIRNAAKHSERRSDNKLVLQLSLLEKDSDILANLKAKRKKRESEIDGEILKNLYFNNSDKYHFLRIKVDMPNPDGVIDTLVDNLADPYLDDNGVMSETTKGLKEMRISAAWLRGYSIDTAIPSNEPPAVSIYSELYTNNKNEIVDDKVTISYILCIPKPCRVAFVVKCDNRDTVNDLLTPYGCKVFTDPFKLKDEEDRDKLINEIANYEIVCMPTNLKAQLCPYISSRYIINEDQTETLLKNLTDSIEKTNYKDEEAKKEAIENSIGSICETWFGTTYNDDILKLVVADEKAIENKKTEKETGSLSSDSNVILTATGSVTEELVNNAVVYSTHFKGLAFKNDEQKEPVAYNKMLERAISIESVTGNNSTARLIRQDEWNKEWKTKILSAAMARVAIFDERIFRSFISTESKVHQDGLSVEKIKKIKTESNDSEGVFQENLKVYGIPLHDSETIFYAQDDECIQNIIDKYLITYSYDVAQKNHERRIWAFDIRVPEKVNNIVEIIGYDVLIGDRVGAYIERKTDVIITIAKISRHSETSQYNVELCDDKKVFANGNGNIFDYITIHQGVLDKIYTTFGIKDNATEKFKVTNALHRCFSKYHTPEDFTKFLPNFIIHSGRSKPSNADMPQPQPFVQFAAVDHAVKDCKYTLVELLATAHYEKSNNNN